MKNPDLAVAYGVARKAKKPMAKHEHTEDCYADGGLVCEYGGKPEADANPGTPKAKADNKKLPDSETMADHFAYGGMAEADGAPVTPARKPDDERPPMERYMANHFAKGGLIADAIMKAKAMDSQVDLNANSEESPNMADQYNYDANGKEQYDLDQLSPQPEDSNEMGDDLEDEDSHDIVGMIRKSMKTKKKA